MSSENFIESETSTLTCKGDSNIKPKFNMKDTLTEDEVQNALVDLNNFSFVKKFKKLEKVWCDPIYLDQKYVSVSFVPSKGATPNKDGMYGMMKVRGVFSNEDEMTNRAEWLIRNVDSYHTIYHAYVGRPFPITTSSDFSKEVDEIKIEMDAKNTLVDDIREKKQEEKKTKEDLTKRSNDLVEESRSDTVDPFERYTELRVKKANLLLAIKTCMDNITDYKTKLEQSEKNILEMDCESSDYKETYMEKYSRACQSSGIDMKKNLLIEFMEDKYDYSWVPTFK